jgi:hypothetical protein
MHACARVGGAAAPEIGWPSVPPYSRAATAAARAIARAAVRRSEFGPPSAASAAALAALGRARAQGNAVFCTEIAMASQRHQLARGWRAPALPVTAADVLAAARTARAPPVAVLRAMSNAPRVAAAARGEPGALGPGFRGDFAAVFEADLGSRVHSLRAQRRAAEFEDQLGAWLAPRLARACISVARESDSRAAGRTLTPDFLLSAPVTINGRLVHWLDAKNYCHYGAALTARNITAQAEKYTKAFGPGAFVFHYGADPDCALLAGVTVLDGGGLDEGGLVIGGLDDEGLDDGGLVIGGLDDEGLDIKL